MKKLVFQYNYVMHHSEQSVIIFHADFHSY